MGTPEVGVLTSYTAQLSAAEAASLARAVYVTRLKTLSAAQAIRAWLDEMRRKVLMAEDQEPDGCLWKNVFLPG